MQLLTALLTLGNACLIVIFYFVIIQPKQHEKLSKTRAKKEKKDIDELFDEADHYFSERINNHDFSNN